MLADSEHWNGNGQRPSVHGHVRKSCGYAYLRSVRGDVRGETMAAFGTAMAGVYSDGTSIPYTFVTTATPAATTNSRVVVLISYYCDTHAVGSVSVGGHTCALNLNVKNNGGWDQFDIWSVPVGTPDASLDSGATVSISPTSGGSFGGILTCVCTITGVDQTTGASGGVDGTSTGTPTAGQNGTGASWTTTAASASGGIAVGGVGFENSATNVADVFTAGVMISGPPTSDQWVSTAGQGAVCGYILGGTTLTGHVNTTNQATVTVVTGGIVGYTDTGGPPATPDPATYRVVTSPRLV